MNTFGNHKIKQTKEKFIIELDIEQLIFALENNPDYEFKITNKKELLDYIANRIFEFTNDYNDEPLFFRTFDELVIQAYEDAEDFIEEVEEN